MEEGGEWRNLGCGGGSGAGGAKYGRSEEENRQETIPRSGAKSSVWMEQGYRCVHVQHVLIDEDGVETERLRAREVEEEKERRNE